MRPPRPKKIVSEGLTRSVRPGMLMSVRLSDPRGVVRMVDRSEASRALAKAIAYIGCGKRDEAERWARDLLAELGMSHLLK